MKNLLYLLALALVALPFGACYGTMVGVKHALPTEEVTVYEDCYEVGPADVVRCKPLDEPGTEERTPGSADLWAGIGVYLLTAAVAFPLAERVGRSARKSEL